MIKEMEVINRMLMEEASTRMSDALRVLSNLYDIKPDVNAPEPDYDGDEEVQPIYRRHSKYHPKKKESKERVNP